MTAPGGVENSIKGVSIPSGFCVAGGCRPGTRTCPALQPRYSSIDRDLFQVSCLLDKYGALGRPVFLTAVGCPGRWLPDPSDESDGRLDPSSAGQWRRPWDPELQAEWMEAIYQLALSKPFVESIALSNLADLHHTMPGGGLLDDMLRPKPSFQKLLQLRERFRRK